ncbi:MAG: 6-pyruvoyl-tetrahydropterin synthase-related protein, partial [Chloroflexota bacterium]
MKRTIRLRHPDVALVILLSLAAGWAFMLRPSLPRGTDTELHVFRAAELGYALRAGVLFPRWAADYYYGYGYPIFNYYAPLTYYLANLFSLGLAGGAVFGVKMVFVAGYLCAGLGTFGFVRRYAGPSGGLIASAAYLFSPYVFLIDPHIRGVLAEFFAVCLLPAVLWSIDTYLRKNSRKHLLVSSLLIAALLLSHNLMGLVGFGMAAAYSVWAALLGPIGDGTEKRWGRLPIFALPTLYGLLLAAFFWLPVILERDAVQLGNLIGPGHFDYRNHFLSLKELLSASIPLDLGAANPAFRFNLGVGQWLLALGGTAALFLPRKDSPDGKAGDGERASHRIGDPLFWLIGLIALTFLMLPASQPLWALSPLAAFLQFPWRLLGPASLCTAILAGYSARLWLRLPDRIQPPASAAALLLPMLFALPIFIPSPWGSFGPTDQIAMLDFELSGTALGTTSTGDYLPAEVDLVPGPNDDLIDSYRGPGPIDKVNRRTLPEGTTVEIVRHRPTLDLLTVDTDERFLLRLYT